MVTGAIGARCRSTSAAPNGGPASCLKLIEHLHGNPQRVPKPSREGLRRGTRLRPRVYKTFTHGRLLPGEVLRIVRVRGLANGETAVDLRPEYFCCRCYLCVRGAL